MQNLFCVFLLSLGNMGYAQKNKANLVAPPYMDYSGPYVIKIHVSFVERPTFKWVSTMTDSEKEIRATKAIDKLNEGFNPYNIYFVWKNLSCDKPTYDIYEPQAGQDIRNGFPTPSDVISIYDEQYPANLGGAGGIERDIPSNALHTYKQDTKETPAAHMNIIIHEMGHLLGLFHPHEDEICNELIPPISNCPNGDICNCCGDFVCDTKPVNSQPFACKIIGDDYYENNYMSYPLDDNCRTLFTPQQTLRMWAYLSHKQNIQVLQDVLVQTIIATDYTISKADTYGNIFVKKGATLDINAPIKMLPGAVIRVETGARLNVNAKITSSCLGKMWQGIVVYGDINAPQERGGGQQGEVMVSREGEIQYAKVGIDVVDDSNIVERFQQGGGIVRVIAGKFTDNEISLRFAPYEFGGMSNKSEMIAAVFRTTDKYVDFSKQKPLYVKLNGELIQVKFHHRCTFNDLRTTLKSLAERADGIQALNASFFVQNCQFNNLGVAIYADQAHLSIGGFVLSGNAFKKCVTGLQTNMYSGFNVYKNTFIFGDNLPGLLKPTYTGAQIKNKTVGFLFAKNRFVDSVGVKDTMIGSHCNDLGANANVINNNIYENIHIGNRAEGNNADNFNGLLYTCNTNIFLQKNDIEIIKDGRIRKMQGLSGDKPVANTFSANGHTIANEGAAIDYYYYKNSNTSLEDPSVGAGYTGLVKAIDVSTRTFCEVVLPCKPCDAARTATSQFYVSKATWQNSKKALINTSDSLQKAALEKQLLWSRLGMNESANFILMGYEQDTLRVQIDSILTWFKRLETFEADLLLAKHYFFEKDLAHFDAIWSDIPQKYELSSIDLIDYHEANGLYAVLRPYINETFNLYDLPKPLLEELKIWGVKCNYAGAIARLILIRSDIDITEDCKPSLQKSVLSSNNVKSENDKVTIFPNPASNSLNIRLKENPKGYHLILMDSNGKICKSNYVASGVLEAQIFTENIPNGFYFLAIEANLEKPTFHKIIIIH